ncbi:hypothetical protein TeGR_g1492 [Tetraparma gracilis]|uniref:Protein kinase domain-containing protein n=1 Tax=Tetraparma gracilis TaxID=2962635 RepID=A0ABQ6NCN3_9STRA|nr:hypothetical protein TeGR_g1492 [Tetraparma gracilis]
MSQGHLPPLSSESLSPVLDHRTFYPDVTGSPRQSSGVHRSTSAHADSSEDTVAPPLVPSQDLDASLPGGRSPRLNSGRSFREKASSPSPRSPKVPVGSTVGGYVEPTIASAILAGRLSLSGQPSTPPPPSALRTCQFRITVFSEKDLAELLCSTVLTTSARVTGFLLATVSKATANMVTSRLCVECEAEVFYVLCELLQNHPKIMDLQTQVSERFIAERLFSNFAFHVDRPIQAKATTKSPSPIARCAPYRPKTLRMGAGARSFRGGSPLIESGLLDAKAEIQALYPSPKIYRSRLDRSTGGVSPTAPTGDIVCHSGSPTERFRKVRTIQANDKKFVFEVDAVDEESGRSRTMIMKETTLPDASPKARKASLTEYNLISKLNASPDSSPGLIPTPSFYEEKGIRTTLIYPLFTTDVFNCVSMYCTEHNTPGVPESISRIWLAQLLHAIRDMSSCGVAHRDVKLENCLLTKEGNVILADLELGLECSSLGGEENGVEILGTPLYIPPEVAKDRKFVVKGGKSDLWALGVMAWEMVAASVPWKGNVDTMAPRKLLEMTTRTSTSSIKNTEGFSNKYFEFIKLIVTPLESRLSVEEAMGLPLFDGIDFDDAASLFPTDKPLKELEAVIPLLKKSSPKAFARSRPVSASELAGCEEAYLKSMELRLLWR